MTNYPSHLQIPKQVSERTLNKLMLLGSSVVRLKLLL